MDATIQLLWNRRGFQPSREASDWACSLLERGIENDAILVLAGNRDLESSEQRRLTDQAVRDIGLERLLEADQLVDAYERESVYDYYAGRIDGWDLILRGCDLYYQSEKATRRFWLIIADDADQHGGQGICMTYPFNRRPFDEVLKDALAANGFPPEGR
jgi:hypothetical protein